ncbi:helix-turn-helix domain-containing protein [Mesorhizobium sp. A556]
MNDMPAPATMEKPAYRISEFCEAFGVGRTKVFDKIGDGRLKIRKAGRMTLIRAEDAKAWLDSLSEMNKRRAKLRCNSSTTGNHCGENRGEESANVPKNA